MRFFHGTAADLRIGDELLPGETVGISYYGRSDHVYMTQSDFSLSEVEYCPSGVRTSEQYALYSAIMWGCWAADVTCKDCDWGPSHDEALKSFLLPSCVHVYEVSPIGPLEYDSANDAGVDACRSASARIIDIMDDRKVASLLEW